MVYVLERRKLTCRHRGRSLGKKKLAVHVDIGEDLQRERNLHVDIREDL
jgi:hypothetical protein